jgi:hypothetical protein
MPLEVTILVAHNLQNKKTTLTTKYDNRRENHFISSHVRERERVFITNIFPKTQFGQQLDDCLHTVKHNSLNFFFYIYFNSFITILTT